MIDLILAVLAVIPLTLWVLFRIIMRLKARKDSGEVLSKYTLAWGLPTLFVGYFLDFVCNMLHSTVLFLEFPKELTVSARVSRHTHDLSKPHWFLWALVSWRRLVARTFRDYLLKPYDPSGGHD